MGSDRQGRSPSFSRGKVTSTPSVISSPLKVNEMSRSEVKCLAMQMLAMKCFLESRECNPLYFPQVAEEAPHLQSRMSNI